MISLKNSNGEWVENSSQVRRLFDEHFMDLFTSSGSRAWGDILDCITPKVTEEMNASFSGSVSVEEVNNIAMHMGGLKAPRPDGFSGLFYQAHWDIIDADVNEIIGEMMNGSQNPMRINATHLVLTPKVQKPEFVSQFHPTSLCNYSYKVLSKFLANCLKLILPDLISTTHNAFVASRQIQDNIGIACELLHEMQIQVGNQIRYAQSL